jgi:hypothetical protein
MFVSSAGFEVRSAVEGDVARLAELDARAFAGADMGYYGETHARCWFEVNPEGLLIAARDGVDVACCYSQYVDFSPDDAARLTTDAEFTDSAFTRATHRPDGNSIHVVTVSSTAPGGRRALFEALRYQLIAQQRSFLILFSRLAGLRNYCRSTAAVAGLGMERVARCYVDQCVSLFGGGAVWPSVGREALTLPPPPAPDPVLNKYLRDRGAEVAAVMVDWIEDPASCNCGALVVTPRGALLR